MIKARDNLVKLRKPEEGKAMGSAEYRRQLKSAYRDNFSQRLTQACDQDPHCPDLKDGRLSWLQKQLQLKGVKITLQAIHKWFNGGTPRPEVIRLLAEILNVDETWFQLGQTEYLTPQSRRVRKAMAQGVVNVVAGFIEMDGGTPRFPEDGDPRAADKVHLYALIRSVEYAIHVASAEIDGENLRFVVPANADDITVLGVLRGDGFNVKIFELTPEVIVEKGEHQRSAIELTVEESDLIPIRSFKLRF